MIEKLKRIFNRRAAKEREMPDPLLPDLNKILGFEADMVIPTVERIHRVMSMYPGSVRHHHSDAGGLLRHSLDVARLCVDNLKRVKPDYSRQEKVASYLVGLLHDIGKIAFYKTDGRYQFNPLLFDADVVILKEQIPHEEGDHAIISAMVMFSILSDDVKSYPVDILIGMFQAILCHHRHTEGENIYSVVLKMSDIESVSNNIEGINTQETYKEETKKEQDVRDVVEEPREINDIDKWVSILRDVFFYNLKKDFEFYLLPYENDFFIWVVYPSAFNRIFSKTKEHPNIVLERLKTLGIVKGVCKVSLEGKGFKASRTLNVVLFHAEKVLKDNEYAFFESQFKVKKIKFSEQEIAS